MNRSRLVLVAACLGWLAPIASEAAVQTWIVQDGAATLSMDSAHLSDLGFEIAQVRTTALVEEDRAVVLEGAPHSFRATGVEGLRFSTSNGAFQRFDNGAIEVPLAGGFVMRTWHPATKEPLTPGFFHEMRVQLNPDAQHPVRIATGDVSAAVPFDVTSASYRFDWVLGKLMIHYADVRVSEEWAVALGQPKLAGAYVGAFELALTATPESGLAIEPVYPEPAQRGGGIIDVTIGELYGLSSFGRVGTFPNGVNGLAAATTSCNSGTERVPWNAPMAETHPSIGVAVLRVDPNGILEMIGRGYVKHGFAALANNQCNLGCEGCGGSELCIGCSDTYSAGLNASRFDLGPRSEINIFTGEWEACGSFFDEPTTPDADCARDYFGAAPDGVWHRVEVTDADLNVAGADYYYEGMYAVAGDTEPDNTTGWREVNPTWSGSSWLLNTVGGGLTPTYRPYIFQWGDETVKASVASDDGIVLIGTQVTDLGGGQWHYEYAVYNWYSHRGVNSFSIPISGLNVSNVGFHDIDTDAGNDWNFTNDGSTLTWSTDDFGTDPDANAIFFQALYNFRFDADQPPTAGTATLGIFRPGVGTSFFANMQVPTSGATDVIGSVQGYEDFTLLPSQPNPFTARTDVQFALAQSRDVKLSVVDVTGRIVQVLVDGQAPAGLSSFSWDGRDVTGSRVASGVYFFRLESGKEVRTAKTTLMK